MSIFQPLFQFKISSSRPVKRGKLLEADEPDMSHCFVPHFFKIQSFRGSMLEDVSLLYSIVSNSISVLVEAKNKS